ncbi:MAG: DUF2892 domain-containing protein [Kangiella sp.]|nr:DUF2892 domain-containing protein [Kangiella sp.]
MEQKKMTAERVLMAFAGFMVLLSVVLTWYLHPYWLWLTVFVGANLFQSAFTGFCPAMMVIKKLGFKTERQAATGS